MKLLRFSLFAVVVYSAALPSADPFCHRIGEPCSKIKRAAEAIAAAFAEPAAKAVADPHAEAFCHRIGEPCSKAKRLAHDLAAIVAETQSNPAAFYDGLKLRSAFPEPDAVAEPDPEPFCHRIGEPCSKLRRDANAFCHRIGEPCSKVKRAAEALAEAVANAEPQSHNTARDLANLEERFCWRIGEPCSKARRDANALAGIAAVTLAEL